MKMLVVCQYYYPEPLRITDICEEFARRGHEVTVLTGLPNYPDGNVPNEYRKFKKRFETIEGVTVKRSFEIGRGNSTLGLIFNYLSFMISGSIKALFLKEEYDVVFVYQLSPVIMAIPAFMYKLRHDKKILLYCLDLWPGSLVAKGVSSNNPIYKIMHRVSKFIYTHVDRISVTSNEFKSYLDRIIGIDPDEVVYLPQYAEDLFSESEEYENEIMINKGKFNFLFAGNVGVLQSIETIILAANELKSNDSIKIHIVGSGSVLEKAKNMANEFELDNVIFYGRRPVEEMPQFYNEADAMILTLIKDDVISCTLPGKVQSYLAAGKAIVGSIDGEGFRLVEEVNCGYVCKAEDHKAFASVIEQFTQASNRIEMEENARKHYQSNFTKKIHFERLEQELTKLIHND